ncbi:MAG TPA: hypothetical protein DDX39_05335 [Bacteroidales bacterium]|nr:MAG: hypothetical protein A2W98_10845 [Bacteroidetes bacterium GWF2_33_38]OFY73913.1 MAG: hypothetical protein A2265_08450 [Bacteroidetes bacterium RIFOXYA12_FULL_33_9]OFY85653.1 MAG: hypothetical protein A2236_02530 [Bacteroidetes bacterium RIFOXYA2_FULL_33_7]HBF88047.1 hypothetical protein [Bacteroidales bacterium]
MEKLQIIRIVEIEHPTTTNSCKITFNDKSFKVGYFESFNDKKELKEKNLWRVVENNNNEKYRKSRIQDEKDKTNTAIEFSTLINGDDILTIEIL